MAFVVLVLEPSRRRAFVLEPSMVALPGPSKSSAADNAAPAEEKRGGTNGCTRMHVDVSTRTQAAASARGPCPPQLCIHRVWATTWRWSNRKHATFSVPSQHRREEEEAALDAVGRQTRGPEDELRLLRNLPHPAGPVKAGGHGALLPERVHGGDLALVAEQRVDVVELRHRPELHGAVV